jgi:predicted metalloprotease with PDZ domain
MKRLIASFAAAAWMALASAATAQINSAPTAAAAPAAAPAVRDTPYPGVIRLHVDVTDLDRKIWTIRQTIPVARSGPVRLQYAEWIPGNHAPRGPIYNLAGIRFSSGDTPLTWRRDAADVYAFVVDAPKGAAEIVMEAQFLTPIESAQGPIMVTDEMLRLNWYVAALYPAGHYARQVNFDVTLQLPDEWDYATALETESRSGARVDFRTVSFETLIDSPLFAGRHMRKWDLNDPGESRVTLNAMGDTPEMVAPPESVLDVHRHLIDEADLLFGARQFDHYDFLLSVSDRLATAGIEHARSSDNGVSSGYFTQWDSALISRDLLAHEYVHSWNGKYRRPAELWTPAFNMPMRNNLLWVYEGQTQYWGAVLAARAGFLSLQQALDNLANTAALYQYRAGRDWRPLEDTTHDPTIAARRSLPWSSWQRSEDYYSEGQLIWLEADTLIRERTGGQRSLDDFARRFFGGRDGDWGQVTYTRDDVIRTLRDIAPYDWDGFFRDRVEAVAKEAPLAGLERGGYRLVFAETPNAVWRQNEARTRSSNLTYSIGLTADSAGKVTAVQWAGPAFQAGITTASTIVGVNGETFTPERLREAVRETRDPSQRLELMLRRGDSLKTVLIEYSGGARYPVLERIEDRPALLDRIYAPRRP